MKGVQVPDDGDRHELLADLREPLAAAIGVAELIEASEPRPGLGMARRLEPDELRVDGRPLPSPVPRVVLTLDPPVDARALCAAWAIDRVVAISGDVHQRSWRLEVAGEDLPDPYNRRIATRPVTVGRWEVRLRLDGRPRGGLPRVVVGGSPAYDILERGGAVMEIEITPATMVAAVVAGDHADARALLDAMAGRYPAWRGGWQVEPGAECVVVYEGDAPVVGATIEHDGRGTSAASRLCVSPDRPGAGTGSALLDILEAVALAHGSERLTLDSSAFLQASEIPYLRHGYVVAPPYDGDADVPVWAERDLRWQAT